MNIFNLRPRDSSGISEYSTNELRIAMPDPGKILSVNSRKAHNMIVADMEHFKTKVDAGEMDLNVGTQIVINDDHWSLATEIINWLRCQGYDMVITVVTQTSLVSFQYHAK